MISKLYYKYKLKSNSRNLVTEQEFLNISQVKHLLIAVECADIIELRDLQRTINPLLKIIPKLSYVVFINARKVDEDMQFVNSNTYLIYKDDLNFGCVPNEEILELLRQVNIDVFVNLFRAPSLVIDFLNKITSAKMRVGFSEKANMTELQLEMMDDDYPGFLKKMIYIMERTNVRA